MKHICAPSSILVTSSIVSSAAARPISGREPAPSPWVILAPSWILLDALDCLSACASVFATRKSTPWTSADRKSVVSGKSVSVRVDLGGSLIIKQKKQHHDT